MPVSKEYLSGSTFGKAIVVAATAGPTGTLLHTTATAGKDEIWLYAINGSTGANLKLTIEFGGVAAPGNHIEKTIQRESGLVPVVPGFVLGSGNVVRAFGASGLSLAMYGYVHRLT